MSNVTSASRTLFLSCSFDLIPSSSSRHLVRRVHDVCYLLLLYVWWADRLCIVVWHGIMGHLLVQPLNVCVFGFALLFFFLTTTMKKNTSQFKLVRAHRFTHITHQHSADYDYYFIWELVRRREMCVIPDIKTVACNGYYKYRTYSFRLFIPHFFFQYQCKENYMYKWMLFAYNVLWFDDFHWSNFCGEH